jgi:hypothetical protein
MKILPLKSMRKKDKNYKLNLAKIINFFFFRNKIFFQIKLFFNYFKILFIYTEIDRKVNFEVNFIQKKKR